MKTNFKPGDPVAWTTYGSLHTGTVLYATGRTHVVVAQTNPPGIRLVSVENARLLGEVTS